MHTTNSRGLSITSLQLVFGTLCTVVGTLVLVAPYHFSGRYLNMVPAMVPVWGVVLVLAGAALVCAAAVAPRQIWIWAAHILAGAALLTLAVSSLESANPAGIPPFAIFGVGIGLAPYLAGRQFGSRLRRLDLLPILLGLATALTGALMLLAQDQFGSSIYDQLRPFLTAYGAAFLGAGVALLVAHIRPACSRWLQQLALLGLSAVLFAFFFGVSLPSGNWVGSAYYGGFATLALLLPWLAPQLRELDGTSLRSQLALVLAAAAAVPFLALTPLYAHQQEERAISEQLSRQETLVSTLAQDVSDYVYLHQAPVKVLARQPELLTLSPSVQQAILQNSWAAYPEVNGFSTIAADGQPIARADGRAGASWVGDPTFEQARGTGQPAIGIRISPITSRPVVTLGVPILGDDGSFLGMVSSSMDSTRMAALLSRTDFGDGGFAYLVDSTGRVIAHPDADLVASLADLSSGPAVAALLLDSGASGSLRTTGPDGPQLASHARLSGLGWGLVVERPVAATLVATRAQLDLMFLGLLLMIAAAAFFGVLAAGWLSRPLSTLAMAVDRLAGGDASAPLPVSGLSEIVGLATAFGKMRTAVALRTAERELAEQALKHQALHDALTGLPNRVLFTDRLEHALVAASRRDNSVAVLYLDLDDFKLVNDTLGHDHGDALLVAIAGRLRACLRQVDTAARLGGDEFTVLLEDLSSESEAMAIADRIAIALRAPLLLGDREVFVKVSIGIAVSGPRADPKDLLRQADLAMYRAKSNGKARFKVFDPSLELLDDESLPSNRAA